MKMNMLSATALSGLILCITHSLRAQNPPAPASTAAPASAVANAGNFLTRTFIVPPDFLSRGKGQAGGPPAAPADPFASPAPAPATPQPARTVLESLGVNFEAAGSSASFNKATSRLVVSNTAEQVDLVEKIVADMSTAGTIPEGLIVMEAFSMPPLAARKALIAHPKETDLYQWIESELKRKDSGVRLERSSVTRVRSGQRAKTEAIDEYAYPTEFDPAQIPQTVSVPAGASGTAVPGGEKAFAPWPITSITPGAMTYRSLGWSLEAELTFSEDRKIADLNLAPESSRLASTVSYGLTGEIRQPVFETQKCSVQLSTATGKPALASSFSPAAHTGVPGGTTEDRVWLLFVTVNQPQ